MYLYISYFSKVNKLQCIKSSVLIFQTWMPKQSFSRHLKCSAWSPALISSHMKEKAATFSLANKMGEGNTNFCLVLPCRIRWELIPFDFSSPKICCQQRERSHQENNSSYILRQRACEQLLWLVFRGWALKVNPSISGFSSTSSIFPTGVGSSSILMKTPMYILLTQQEHECE